LRWQRNAALRCGKSSSNRFAHMVVHKPFRDAEPYARSRL
jgi:hypothetical protein